MSLDKYTYIGPYIVATVNTKEIESDLCATHNFPKDANFCPKCGKNKKQRYYRQTVEDTPDFWDEDYSKGPLENFLIINHHLEFSEQGKVKQFYFPNQFKDEISFIDSCENELNFELTPEKVQNSLDVFQKLFAPAIEYMKKWFDVQIIYGVINYRC